jgi:hypothetical protein
VVSKMTTRSFSDFAGVFITWSFWSFAPTLSGRLARFRAAG